MSAASALNAASTPISAARRRRLPRGVAGVGVLLLAFLLAVTGQASVLPVASAAAPTVLAATGGTGTGGAFNPLLARVVDTRNGTGGSSSPLTANIWRSVQVLGVGGVPASGVSSVAVTVTALTPANVGVLGLAPNTSLPGVGTFLVYQAAGNTSNTGVVDVGTDGKIAVRVSTPSVNVLIDIQGYFTVGNGTPAAGGYVSAHSTRIVNSVSGLGMPGGAAGKVIPGSTTTFSAVGGSTGIPASATAVYANITVQTTTTANGWVQAYPTGTARPLPSLNYPGAETAGVASATAIGATVDLNSAGQFDLYTAAVGGGGSVDVFIDIQGYFDGEPSTSGFTPLSSRVLDTRVSPSVPLAAGSVTTVQLGGVGGIPAGSSSLAGVAVNVQTLDDYAAGGYLRMWPGDQTEPSTTSTINFDPTSITSNLTLIRPSVIDGTIKVRNNSSVAVNLVLDAEGFFTNPSVLAPAIGPNYTNTGSRAAASMIKRTLTDRSGVQINPGNGNLLYTQSLLSLAGVGQAASVGLRYNELNDARPTLNVGLFEAQLYRNGATNKVTYTGPDGAGYEFVPTGTSYAGKDAAGNGGKTLFSYNVPVGINATLVRVGAGYGPGTEYDLTFHPSQAVNVYTDNGSNVALNFSQDVTGANKISYTYAKGALTTITDTQGRTISFAYTSPNNTTQPSTITDNSLGRTITLTYGNTAAANGALSKIVDATGAQTLFAYNTAGKLSSTTDGRGDVTAFTYDSGFKLLTLTAAAGSTSTTPGVWTWAYGAVTGTVPNQSRATNFTDPNSNTTIYTVDNATAHVIGVRDARTFLHTTGYNDHNDTTSMANAYNDATNIGIATSTYNLTSITAPSTGGAGTGDPGRSQTYQYTSAPSGAAGTYTTADYRPMSSTDSQANITTIGYNSFGEATVIDTPKGTDGITLGGTLHRAYQGDNTATPAPDCSGMTGQLCTSTDGKGNITAFTYTAGNVTTITPPAPLGVRTFTYDAAGRKVSQLDGRGHTAYTCYDGDDRILQVSYTTAACGTISGVTYTYDPAGNMTRRVDAAGTTTVSYDAMNRPLSKTDGTNPPTSVGYDKAGNITAFTDQIGTTSYTYDPANNVTTLAEPGGSCPATPTFPNSTRCVGFSYDNAERRTVTSLPNGVTNTVSYDASSRLIGVTAAAGATQLATRTYSYKKDTTAGDSALIWTTTDPLAVGGSTISGYLYDAMNRLRQTAFGPTPAAGAPFLPTTVASWTYDLNGNRTQQVITGAGAATTFYGYNAADQLCWSAAATGAGCATPTGGTAYTYDGNGNQTSGANSYSNYDQLTAAATVGAQTYAGTTNNERAAAGSATFTNSILGHVSETVTPYSTQEYIRDPSGTLIAMQTYPNGGSTPTEYYYTADIVGSTIAITDNTGATAATYTYDSWGNTTATTGGTLATTINPWRYGFGYTEPNGTIKLGARYYNPTFGRFTQPDPSGQNAGYSYAGADPINRVDPSGLNWFWEALAGAASFAVYTTKSLAVESAGLVVGVGVATYAVTEYLATSSDGTGSGGHFCYMDDPTNCRDYAPDPGQSNLDNRGGTSDSGGDAGGGSF